MGLSSRLEYKSWDFGFSFRANIGNYVYNDKYASRSNMNLAEIVSPSNYLSNRPRALLSDNWQTYDERALLSDRWIQNASFLKLDNVTLGYSFSKLFNTSISGRIYGTASNLLTITKYDGIDPEVTNFVDSKWVMGIDNNMYPRPMSFILGVNLNF